MALRVTALFVFALASTHIHGYRRYRDPWLILATITMFSLSVIFAILALARI